MAGLGLESTTNCVVNALSVLILGKSSKPVVLMAGVVAAKSDDLRHVGVLKTRPRDKDVNAVSEVGHAPGMAAPEDANASRTTPIEDFLVRAQERNREPDYQLGAQHRLVHTLTLGSRVPPCERFPNGHRGRPA